MVTAAAACSSQERSHLDAETERVIDQMVKAHESRTIYRRLDRATLQAMPDDRLELAVIDYIHAKLAYDQDLDDQTIMALSPALRGLYATWELEAEVNNGGFNQFFWNSSGRWAEQAVLGFRLFGAEEHARIAAEAIEVYAREKAAQDKLKAENSAAAFVESYEHTDLGALDTRFYNVAEDLGALRIAYIRAHPDEFTGD